MPPGSADLKPSLMDKVLIGSMRGFGGFHDTSNTTEEWHMDPNHRPDSDDFKLVGKMRGFLGLLGLSKLPSSGEGTTK